MCGAVVGLDENRIYHKLHDLSSIVPCDLVDNFIPPFDWAIAIKFELGISPDSKYTRQIELDKLKCARVMLRLFICTRVNGKELEVARFFTHCTR